METSAKHLEVTDSTPSRSLSIDELEVGFSVVQKFVFGAEQLSDFKKLANDRAPIHADKSVAQKAGFDAPIIQGFALAVRFSRLIGMYLPGERAILEKIELKYKAPVFAGQELVYTCSVTRMLRPLQVVEMSLAIATEGKDCVTGRCQCVLR